MSWLTFIPIATPSMQRQETVDKGVEAAKTSAKWVDDKASGLAESMVDTWMALKDATKLAKNPASLIDKLNSDGDSAVVYFTAGGDLSVGVLMGMKEFGGGLTVRQIGDGTVENPAVYEITANGSGYEGIRLGISKLPKPVKNLAYTQADIFTNESLTFRFSSKAEATRAVESLARANVGDFLSRFETPVAFFEALSGDDKAKERVFGPIGDKITDLFARIGGWENDAEISKVTSDLEDLLVRRADEKVEPGDLIRADDLAFLDEHFYGTADLISFRGLAAADTTRIAKALGVFGFEGRISGELGLSRTVALPEGESGGPDYKPGQVSYSLSLLGDATTRSKAVVDLKKSGSDGKGGSSVYNIDYARHGDGGRSVTLTWDLEPSDFDGRTLVNDPLTTLLHGREDDEKVPKWATIVTTKRNSIEDGSSLISSKRPDKEVETLRITIDRPFERAKLLGELLLSPDLDKSLAELDEKGIEGIGAVRSIGQIAASGVEVLPGLGLPIGGGGFSYINVGVDDLRGIEHEIVMGEGFPGAHENPPRFMQDAPGRRINPRLLQDGYEFVEVREGDTLSDIARRENVDVEALISLNREHIPDPDELRPGDLVFIPKFALASAEGDAAARDEPGGQTA